MILGSTGVGGLLGSLISSRLSRLIGVGRAFLLGSLLFPLPLLLVPLAGGPRWLVLAFLFTAEFGCGLGVMILDISIGTIFAALIPDRLRARVSGAYTVINYGVRPVGAVLGGVLGAVIGVRQALFVAAVGAILGFLWLLPSPLPRMRELPETAA